VRIVVELLCVRLVLIDQFDRHGKRTRHIFIVGIMLLVAIQLIVDGTDPQHLCLQGNADGDFESGVHFSYPRAARPEVSMGRL
jgi:hypothetical protein